MNLVSYIRQKVRGVCDHSSSNVFWTDLISLQINGMPPTMFNEINKATRSHQRPLYQVLRRLLSLNVTYTKPRPNVRKFQSTIHLIVDNATAKYFTQQIRICPVKSDL